MTFAIDANRLTDAGAAQVGDFLRGLGVRFGVAEHTVRLMDGDRLVGTGSLDGSVLKYIGVAPDIEGEGGCATIVSALVTEAYNRGRTRLFIYTKPENTRLFASLGFYELARTKDMLLLENSRNGLERFLASVKRGGERNGAIVLNANPFTNGHLYLCEQAAAMCEGAYVYVFVVSEDRSLFPADVRLRLVREGTAHIKNAVVCESRDYLVSYATFPDYFLKEGAADTARPALDIALFGGRIAPALNIVRRFVGSEPYSPVTAAYNAAMKEKLPEYGIELVELERTGGISASRVRELMQSGDIEGIEPLVPKSTYEYIKSHA